MCVVFFFIGACNIVLHSWLYMNSDVFVACTTCLVLVYMLYVTSMNFVFSLSLSLPFSLNRAIYFLSRSLSPKMYKQTHFCVLLNGLVGLRKWQTMIP